jgi:hypothetical protein
MEDIKQALKQAEQTLRLNNRYAKEFGLAGMEQETKNTLAVVRKAIRALKEQA